MFHSVTLIEIDRGWEEIVAFASTKQIGILDISNFVLDTTAGNRWQNDQNLQITVMENTLKRVLFDVR